MGTDDRYDAVHSVVESMGQNVEGQAKTLEESYLEMVSIWPLSGFIVGVNLLLVVLLAFHLPVVGWTAFAAALYFLGCSLICVRFAIFGKYGIFASLNHHDLDDSTPYF